MRHVGIEDLNVFGGLACLGVSKLVEHRNLDAARFENLMMKEKTVALTCEDPVTFAVNAAKPIIDNLTQSDKESIELLITCSESGIDFGKSLSTYIHDYLDLSRNCRMFELKQACYAGTAGLQMAVNFILSQTSPGARALVIATDISRFILNDQDDIAHQDWSYAEPSSGAGAVALLVSESPSIFQVDVGASGYYGYEVMDTCRPTPDAETGNADLSLLSYLDCCENAFREYANRVSNTHYRDTFTYLCFHTPFAGMVKGAHRSMMRKILRSSLAEIEDDFSLRVAPGLDFCQRVGNIMGATIFLSLASTIHHGNFETPRRIGCFSYGSGCCSEFYSGVIQKQSSALINTQRISKALDRRRSLDVREYDHVLNSNSALKFGVRNVSLDDEFNNESIENFGESSLLVLKSIDEFHREYQWT